jgi:hypothetical protein
MLVLGVEPATNFFKLGKRLYNRLKMMALELETRLSLRNLQSLGI